MDRGSIVSGKKTGLQFSDPIPTLKFRQGRITCQIALKPELIELIILERAKFRSETAKAPDKAELHFDVVDNETEPDLLRKPEASLGFTLDLDQRISYCQQVFNQVVAAKTGVGNVTDFACGIEGAAHQIAAGPDMSSPWQDDISEGHIASSLK